MPLVSPERANVWILVIRMPKNLKRYYGKGDLHYLTFSCYRRFAPHGTARARIIFVKALVEIRKKYGFAMVGYVLMPEHVRLLIGESNQGTPTTAVHSLKLRVSKRMRRGIRKQSVTQGKLPFGDGQGPVPRFWQERFYDINDYRVAKGKEKLEYVHRNPVTRGLVRDPKDCLSYRRLELGGNTVEPELLGELFLEARH